MARYGQTFSRLAVGAYPDITLGPTPASTLAHTNTASHTHTHSHARRESQGQHEGQWECHIYDAAAGQGDEWCRRVTGDIAGQPPSCNDSLEKSENADTDADADADADAEAVADADADADADTDTDTDADADADADAVPTSRTDTCTSKRENSSRYRYVFTGGSNAQYTGCGKCWCCKQLLVVAV